MTYRPYDNKVMPELMVPRDPEVAERIEDFYGAIGWDVHYDPRTKHDTLVSPDVSTSSAPTIAYKQTQDCSIVDQFTDNPDAVPSKFSCGAYLSHLPGLVRLNLVLPSNDHVETIFKRGGSLLEKHTFTQAATHDKVQSFAFRDPFNYPLHVTANPGYKVNKPEDEPLIGKRIKHVNGTSYVIDAVVICATGYEQTGNPYDPVRYLLYTQINPGEHPVGTQYVRPEEEILGSRTVVRDNVVPLFNICSQA